MKTASVPMLLAAALLIALPAHAHRLKDDASVRIVEPLDGTEVSSPVRLRFEARRIPVAPVGINKHRAGHFILLIDHAHPDSEWEHVIAMDAQHLHFVEGESEAEIELPPGQHTLQVLLADEEHVAWDAQLVSDRIRIVVLAE